MELGQNIPVEQTGKQEQKTSVSDHKAKENNVVGLAREGQERIAKDTEHNGNAKHKECLTETERKERITQLWEELKSLLATPRSDWHAAFEAVLRIDLHRYGNRVSLKREQVLGTMPPRVDYLVVTEDEDVVFDKEIFPVFRKHNVIEYKNPNDSLNERTLRKICGYANFYIGVAEHEGDVPADQVAISIFRAKPNKELFRKLEKAGYLMRSRTQGIYQVIGLTDLPFQIVITDELSGEGYAAYRALNENAKRKDIEYIIENGEQETDETVRTHYRVLLDQISRKNPKMMESIRSENDMEDALMELLRDRIDKETNEKVNEKEKEVKLIAIKKVMEAFNVSVEKAMESLEIPTEQRTYYAGMIKKL